MDTYTRAYMAATMPSCETLSSIGSVAANWARTDDEEAEYEFAKYSCSDPLAESILATQGIVAYEEYIAEVQARKAADRDEAERQRAKREARRQKIRAIAAKIREFASRHF
ncbi:hypothetical protein MMC30_000159 [Trapelia coarctata]|nr:hypothetical protein [Trapelia coarctata]